MKQVENTAQQAWNLLQIGWIYRWSSRHIEAERFFRDAAELALADQSLDAILPAVAAASIGQLSCSRLLRGDAPGCWEQLESERSRLGDAFYDAVQQLGDAVFLAEKADGRAAGFAIGRQILDGLLSRRDQLDLRRAVQAIFTDMLMMVVSPELFADLAAECHGECNGESSEAVRTMELVQGYLAGTVTETQLQVEDPDVATTVKTIAAEIERASSYRRARRQAATTGA